MSLYGLINPKGPSGFGYSWTAEEVTAGLSLAAKTILVTGCNSGLGFETMRVLAPRALECWAQPGPSKGTTRLRFGPSQPLGSDMKARLPELRSKRGQGEPAAQ